MSKKLFAMLSVVALVCFGTVTAQAQIGIFDGNADVGSVATAGSVVQDGDNWTVIGSGADIWGQADAFQYLYKEVSGDFMMSIDNVAISANADSPSTSDWQKIGIMARQSLDAGSAYALAMLRSSDQAYSLQWRDAVGVDANWNEAEGQVIPPEGQETWAKLILKKLGNTFTASYLDADGVEMTVISHDVVMSGPFYVGIAVTSHEDGLLSDGTFSNPQIEAIGPLAGWESDSGMWYVEDGVLKMVAEDTTDPKHLWIALDIPADYTVQADMKIGDWTDGDDMSRAGVGVRIQPGDSAEGLNLLFHQDQGRVQYLNDKRGWGPEESIPWVAGAWYTLTLSVSGNALSGMVAPADGSSVGWMLADWDGGSTDPRVDGHPGLAGNSNVGTVAYDNFKVIVDGAVVYENNFGYDSSAPSWELMK